MVTSRGFEPTIIRLRVLCPSQLDDDAIYAVDIGRYRSPAHSGGVSSPLEYVDTIINITPYFRLIFQLTN